MLWQEVCDKPCLVLVRLWPVSQITGHHPDDDYDDDDDGDEADDDDDDDEADDDDDDAYLCLSARVMYQSKTAVSGNTYQAGMVSIWQGNIYFSTGIQWPFFDNMITR